MPNAGTFFVSFNDVRFLNCKFGQELHVLKAVQTEHRCPVSSPGMNCPIDSLFWSRFQERTSTAYKKHWSWWNTLGALSLTWGPCGPYFFRNEKEPLWAWSIHCGSATGPRAFFSLVGFSEDLQNSAAAGHRGHDHHRGRPAVRAVPGVAQQRPDPRARQDLHRQGARAPSGAGDKLGWFARGGDGHFIPSDTFLCNFQR